MATANPFDLLGDDAEDPLQLAARQKKPQKAAETPAPKKGSATQPSGKQKSGAENMPSKPLPPAQAVRETRNEYGRGSRGAGRGYGRGRGGVGYNKEFNNSENQYNSYTPPGQNAVDNTSTENMNERRSYGSPRGSSRGGRRGGFNNEEGDRPRRLYERHSGTGRGSEFKRDGSGRGNWGSRTEEISIEPEEVSEIEKGNNEKTPLEEAADGNKDAARVNEVEEKESENKEMTLEEYQKILEEKRKALQNMKVEERKVDVEKEFGDMQPLSSRKISDDMFMKLGVDKDKRKENAEREERSKKSVSINEFLKPMEGERYYRGRGRGRGIARGGGGYAGANTSSAEAEAPSIEDPGEFPTLGGK